MRQLAAQELAGLRELGIPVRRRIGLPSPANPHNRGYLETKRAQTGHLIETDDEVARAG